MGTEFFFFFLTLIPRLANTKNSELSIRSYFYFIFILLYFYEKIQHITCGVDGELGFSETRAS